MPLASFDTRCDEVLAHKTAQHEHGGAEAVVVLKQAQYRVLHIFGLPLPSFSAWLNAAIIKSFDQRFSSAAFHTASSCR